MPQRELGPVDLGARDPKVGDTLLHDGELWEVTDHSRYKNDEGYRVDEWCCETAELEAYLLKERQDSGPHRWFFTRWIDPGQVTLPGGERLPRWDASRELPEPPKALMSQGRIYLHADTTDGVYEEEPGESLRKVTWDYWDETKRSNLAIELWGDGGADHYRGRYIEAAEVQFRASASSLEQLEGHPVLVAFLVMAAALFFCAFVFSLPMDETMTLSLALACLAPLAVMARLPAPCLAGAAAGSALLAWIFHQHPPLSSGAGLAALIGWPALAAFMARDREDSEPAHLAYLAAVSMFLPLLGWGGWHYFRHAPSHTLGQYALALAPAVVGALSSYWLFRGVLEGGARPPA